MAETTPETTPQQSAWQGVMEALNTLKDAIEKLQTSMTPSENGNTAEAPAQEPPEEESVAEEPANDTPEDANDENKIPNDLMDALTKAYGSEEDIPDEVIEAVKKNPPKDKNTNTIESPDKTKDDKTKNTPDKSDENDTDKDDKTTDDTKTPDDNALDGLPDEFKQLFQFLQIFLELVKSFTQIIGAFINSPQALANAADSLTNQNPQNVDTPAQEPAEAPTQEPATEPAPTPEPTPASTEPLVTPATEPTPASTAEPVVTPTPEPTTEPPLAPTSTLATTYQGNDGYDWSVSSVQITHGSDTYVNEDGQWKNLTTNEPVDFTGENGLFNQCPGLRNHITSQTNEDGSVTMFGTPDKSTDVTLEFKDNMLSKIKVGSSEYMGDGQGGFYGPGTGDGTINVTDIMNRHDVADRIKTGIDNSGVTNPSTPMVGPSSVINAVMNANQR